MSVTRGCALHNVQAYYPVKKEKNTEKEPEEEPSEPKHFARSRSWNRWDITLFKRLLTPVLRQQRCHLGWGSSSQSSVS